MLAGPALALVLGACGGSAGTQPQVASLPSAGTGAAAPSSPTTSEDASRPRARIDDTQEQLKAREQVYYQCEKDHGHRMEGPGGYAPDPADTSATAKAADQACENKRPLPPIEMDQATNPHYLDNYRTYISCINDHGDHVVATDPFGSGWTYAAGSESLPEDQRNKIEQDCQVSSFKL